MLSFLSPSTGLTDIFLVYIHDLHEIYNNNKNAMLFNIRTWKAHNLAENQSNLTEKLKKKLVLENPSNPLFASIHVHASVHEGVYGESKS